MLLSVGAQQRMEFVNWNRKNLLSYMIQVCLLLQRWTVALRNVDIFMLVRIAKPIFRHLETYLVRVLAFLKRLHRLTSTVAGNILLCVMLQSARQHLQFCAQGDRKGVLSSVCTSLLVNTIGTSSL